MQLSPRYARLLLTLTDPTAAARQSEMQWAELIATARSANLLGTLATKLHQEGISGGERVDRHLDGARNLSARQQLSVLWEAHQLQRALGHLNLPVVLLKGAAYVMSGHPTALGRMFGDIDILVPKTALGDVESSLMLRGWVSEKRSAYDQHYYRTWMHEIPPMRHIRRGTVIDVHHTILPLTARNAPDPAQIVARSLPLAESQLPTLRIPSVEDLLIHSTTHLVHEGELHNGLRDLCDIDCLIKTSSNTAGYWARLVQNAAGNDLAGPVCLGLQLARAIYGSPVPDSVLFELSKKHGQGGSRRWLHEIYATALQNSNASEQDLRTSVAKLFVYVRSHNLRMPAPMLARHLAIKAWAGWRSEPTPPQPENLK